jgi:hypothetical protein
MAEKAASPAARTRRAPTPLARVASWFVVIAAFLLIAVALGSYYYHRRQLDSIAASHLRLVVAGPGQLHAGMPSVFNLLATTVTGEQCAAQVEWSLSTPDGKRLVDRQGPTDEQGRLTMIVPADMDLPTRTHGEAQLTVTAGAVRGGAGNETPLSISLPLPIRPKGYLTCLWVDRHSYRPGETIFYRSLTLSRFSLSDRDTLPLEFEILDPKSAPLPNSRLAGLTDHGSGNGSFRLPDALPAGVYTLVARGWEDAFPEAHQEFEVVGPAPHSQPDATAQGEKVENQAPGNGGIHTEFFPEGGSLAAGLENRVFFSACDGKKKPLAIRGRIVDSKGKNLVEVKSSSGGLGVFSFVPDAAETYRLVVSSPAISGGTSAANSESSPQAALLPPASAATIAIAAGRGVFSAGAPLELTIRTAKDLLPLVVTARVRGVLVGQQMMITSASSQLATAALSVPLDDKISGLIRLTVYDYSKSPPKALAERFVYRQPRPLVVHASEGGKPGRDVVLSVQQDKIRAGATNARAAAALAVTVAGGKTEQADRSDSPGADLMHSFLADGDVGNLAALHDISWNVVPANSARGNSDSGEAGAGPEMLDLILGCLRPLDAGKTGDAQRAQVETDPAAPELLDNLNELRSQYEARLSEYRAHRTRVVNALIMLSFFGGLALALLVTMLALLRIVWGNRLWLPTAIATIGCVVVTAVSNEPSRMQPVEAAAVGFAPYTPVAAADLTDRRSGLSAAAEPAPSDSSLRSLAEMLDKAEHDSEEVRSARFSVRQYVQTNSAAAVGGKSPRPLAWYPLLITDDDGRVTLPGLVPAAGQVLRLFVDAHCDGRIESCELTVKQGFGSK